MKCDFCNEEAVLTSGYHYCQKCSREQDRIAIHNMISDEWPTVTMTRIRSLCCEMFGLPDYSFSAFPRLYAIFDRGKTVVGGLRNGYYRKPQAQYLNEVFGVFLKERYPQFYERVKGDKVERFY